MVEYAFIAVEGNHDQAFIGKILKLLGFKDFRETDGGVIQQLDPFWKKLVPSYPTKKGELYKRLPMPCILYTDSLSIAIYGGEGSNFKKNVDAILTNESKYQTDLSSFVVIADADDQNLDKVIQPYVKCFQEYFKNFPNKAGTIDKSSSTYTGIYVLPDNASQGTLDHLLCQCGEVAYLGYMKRGKAYLANFTERELKWKDYQKALVATLVSVLKPGKTNTASINDNHWVSETTRKEVPELNKLINFLIDVLNI
ncbi:MAG: hypothetical protein BRC33_11740 [Cyanobacteria bacterium SW_9_44_58]|nr:MAG: hypothetical protein BRC33_11740 [Cyanobacteria bacterium SW_9_44_58]